MALEEKKQENKREEWRHEVDLAIIKEEERRKTVLQQQAILAMGFSEEKDANDNNVPDVMEYALKGIEADIKRRKQNLDERKFEHDREIDKEEIKIKKKAADKKPTTK